DGAEKGILDATFGREARRNSTGVTLSIGMCRVKRTQSIGCGLVLALAGLSCAWPSTLLADEAPATQPVQHADSDVSMKKWLSDLASPEASIRDAARAKLMTLGRDQLPELQKLVGQ